MLKQATSSHRKYTQIASDGHGCDRHLLALRVLNRDQPAIGGNGTVPMHPMFEDPIFATSQTWKLSTSGLQPGEQLMGTGFGATFKDGYGVNYMAGRTVVKFGIETKTDEESLTAAQFAQAITGVLNDMRALCDKINGQEKQSTVRL